MENKRKLLNFRALPVALLFVVVEILLVSLLGLVYGLIGLLVAGVATICTFSIKKYRKAFPYFLLTFVLMVAVLISSAVQFANFEKPKQMLHGINVTGVVHSDSHFKDKYIVISDITYGNNFESGNAKNKAQFYLPLDYEGELSVGDTVHLNCTMHPKRVVLTQSNSVGAYIKGYRYELTNVQVLDVVAGKPSFLEGVRENAKNALLKYVPAGEIIYAMIFGNSGYLDRDFRENSQLIGLAHLFAVSGLHVGIVAAMIGWICKKSKAGKYADYFCVLIFSLFYSILVGFGPSVQRAFLMLMIYKTCKMLGLRNSSISSLALSCIIIMLAQPIMLYSLSFQLSVFSIVGIIFFSKAFEKIFKTRFKRLNSYAAISLAVNFAILPIILHYIGGLSLLFLPANLIILPIIALIFPFVFIFAILSGFIQQIAYLLVPFGYIFKGIEFLVNLIALVPFLSLNFTFDIIDVIFYTILLVALSSFAMYHKRAKVITASATFVVLMALAIFPIFGRIDGSIRVEVPLSFSTREYVMLDIKNEHYLVANGNLTLSDMKYISLYMQDRGIMNLDGLVKASFSDEDAEILQDFKDELEIEQLITYSTHYIAKAVFDENVYYTRSIGDYIITPFSNEEIVIKSPKSMIMFANISKWDKLYYPRDEIDLLFSTGGFDSVIDVAPKYFVNNSAVMQNIPYSIFSYFTFIIKNDTIRVL